MSCECQKRNETTSERCPIIFYAAFRQPLVMTISYFTSDQCRKSGWTNVEITEFLSVCVIGTVIVLLHISMRHGQICVFHWSYAFSGTSIVFRISAYSRRSAFSRLLHSVEVMSVIVIFNLNVLLRIIMRHDQYSFFVGVLHSPEFYILWNFCILWKLSIL